MNEEEAMVIATQVSALVMGIVAAIQAGLLYEWIALKTGKVPTITRLVNKAPRFARALFVASIAVGWAVWGAFHFKAV